MKEYGIEAPKVREIAMEVQYRMRNWYGHNGEKRRALRGKNDDGNVRKRGRPNIRWLDRVRGYIKEKGLSGREYRPTTEIHINRRTATHTQKVGLK